MASALRAAVPALVATVTADAAATSRLAAQAVQRGDDVLAVFGGDGTVH
ncbi:MAG: sphingosine kinase, partial [Actinomycetota bacterium]|nr:sphingosine kinase [Actinomycetota bacterium]